jgi:glycosyltransferase involved in cell wall biosynthesis
VTPLISIVVPVYQVENYIANTIKSIINQTYSSIEVILVNDGTKDKSIEIALTILDSGKVNYTLINQDNMGIAAARNTGIRNSKGKWILMVDSDDVIAPDLLARSFEVSLKYNIGVVFCNYQIVSFKNILKKSHVLDEDFVIEQNEILTRFLKRDLKLIVPGMLIKKELIDLNGLWFNETIKYSSEQHFIWRLLFAMDKVAFIKDQLYNYLNRGGNSIMASSGIDKVLTGYAGMKNLEAEISEKQGIKKHILPRWVFASLKSSTHGMDFHNFSELSKKMDYTKYIKRLIFFPDIRISILSIIMAVDLKTFYRITKLME